MTKKLTQIESRPTGLEGFIAFVVVVLAVLVCGFNLWIVTADWRAANLPIVSTKAERDAYASHLKARAAAKSVIEAANGYKP